MNKRTTGTDKENLACRYLEENNACILDKNFRCRQGEIDIIAKDGRFLCFIEVKYRQNDKYGYAQEAVNRQKRQKICKVSKFYLYSKYKSYDLPVRYDVIAISQTDDILVFNWIKNAFEYED